MVLIQRTSNIGWMNIMLSYHFPWLVLTSKMRATKHFYASDIGASTVSLFLQLLTVLYYAHIYPYSYIFFLLCLNFQVHGNSFNHPKDFSNLCFSCYWAAARVGKCRFRLCSTLILCRSEVNLLLTYEKWKICMISIRLK